VSKVDNRKSDLSVISSFEYERDPVGNPTSILREDGSVVYYEYDPKHQLTRETQRDSQGQDIYAWEWDYDAAGNRTYQIFNGVTTYYQYNEANELTEETTDGVTTYHTYDRCGNTTAKHEPDGTTYYHWDYENLLRQIDLPGGAHNYFSYDADSKRISKQDSEGFSEFIYQGPDMLKLLMERDEQKDTQAHYTMGNGLEAMRRDSTSSGIASGTSSFYHYDALGSTFELTNADEDITDTYLYNAWGELLSRTGSTLNPHTYVGQARYYLTPDSLLYLLGLRYYAPPLGRFWTVDPVKDRKNWFVYSANRPVGVTDPTGTRCCLDFHHPASELTWQESRWVHRYCAWCFYDVWLDLVMFIMVQKGHSPEDCFALQWLKGFEHDPVSGLKQYPDWTLDGGRPYPHFQYGKYNVIWSDRPGISDKPLPCGLLKPHFQNLSFITCICSKHSGKVEPKPVACFEWHIGFRVAPSQCQLTAYKYSLPKPTASYPEPCRL